METVITLVLTLSLFISGHRFLLGKKEEKLVGLLVYSSFVRVAISGSRIIPCSLVVVVVCAEMKRNLESLPDHHSTAAWHSTSDVTRLVATEHVRNKCSLRESIHSKSDNLRIALIYLQSAFKLHLLQSIKQPSFLERVGFSFGN